MYTDQEETERYHKRVGFIISLTFHAVLAFIFLIALAWSPPDPPIPTLGIEVAFGFDDAGAGEVKSETPANNSNSFDKAITASNNQPKVVETKPQPTPTPTPQPKADPVPQETEVNQEVTPVDVPSEVSVPVAEKPADKPQPKPDPVVKPKEETPVKEEPAPVEEPKPQINNSALLGPSSNEDGTSNENIGSQSGNTNTPGNQGNPQGSLNADAMLGKGGKGGTELNLSGWSWTEEPNKKDDSNETGTVVIRFKIDRNGEVVSSTIETRTVSYNVALFYKKVLDDMVFRPTGTGQVSNFTIGSITFNIVTK